MDDLPIASQSFPPSDPDRPAPAPDRRAFLRSAALIAAGLTLARNLRDATARGEADLTAEVIAEAEKIIGLTFTEEERGLMVGPLAHARENYELIRALQLPNEVAPALLFRVDGDPPAGASPAASEPGPAVSAPREPRPVEAEDLAFHSVRELAAWIEHGELSPVELTELYLDRLRRIGPRLACVVSLRETEARREAARAEAEIRAGRYRGPLHGIPWGAKDLLATRDTATTWGAEPYQDQRLDFDAAVVERLSAAGAILVAKLSLGALAQGDVWFGGRTLSPWDTRRGSSGSSAGPASATAAGLVGFSVGSETNGSIVMPSTVCGVSGLRPTFGRISRHGAMNLSFSMDKIGPIARTVEDCASVFAALHGRDPRDPASVDAPFAWPPARDSVAGMKVGWLEQDFARVGMAEEAALNAQVRKELEQLGAELVSRDLPEFPVDPLRMILTVEAAAMFEELTLSNRDEMLRLQHPLAWPNAFRVARLVPAVEYLKAQQARALLMRKMNAVMEGLDALLTPSTTGQTLTVTNLTGHPAVVMPSGFVHGTPRSVTLVGPLFGEDRILALAAAYQRVSGWHRQHPIL